MSGKCDLLGGLSCWVNCLAEFIVLFRQLPYWVSCLLIWIGSQNSFKFGQLGPLVNFFWDPQAGSWNANTSFGRPLSANIVVQR